MPFDFDAIAVPFRMQPGLRRLAPGAAQLHAIHPGDAVFAEKLAVVGSHADQALLCAPGFDDRPAWRALAEAASAQCGDALAWDGEALTIDALGLRVSAAGAVAPGGRVGQPVHAGAQSALAALAADRRLAGALALSLHEDFAIVDGRTAHLPAMAVCLPSHWAPADKVGRHFAEVHAPVADNAMLLAAGAHLMKLVCGPERWERFVWTITTHAGYDQHPTRHERETWPAAGTPEAIAALANFRTERQSFIALPELQQAVFTIEVQVRPLAAAIDSPHKAQRLHDALASMSDAVLAYRSLAPARAGLLAWLAARAGGPATA